MELDAVLKLLGSYGRYQVLLCLLVAVMDSWTASWHMLIMTFIGFEPQHYCKISDPSLLNTSIPVHEDGRELVYSKCEMFTNHSESNITEPCQNGWTYNTDTMLSSVVTEWNLVCDYNYLAETSQSVYMGGLFLGGCLMGPLSDRFGRKKIMFLGFAGEAIFGTAIFFAPNLYVFVALRFMVGMFVVGANLTGFIVACELFPPAQRSIFGTLHELQWTIGCCLLPLIAFVLRNFGWQYIQLFISLPAALTFLTWRLVPESAPWLISKGRLSDAEAVLEKAARLNRKTIPEMCLHNKAEDEKLRVKGQTEAATVTYTPLDLFKTPQLRKITLGAALFWFANVLNYYGLSQNIPNLDGDLYVNFFLMFVVEIPSLALSMILLYKFDRRYTVGPLYCLAGTACIITPFIPEKTDDGTDISWMKIGVLLLGKSCTSATFVMTLVYTAEMFPTVIRATGFTFTNIFGRIAGVFYPYVLYLNKKEELGQFRFKLPYLIFGSISILTAMQVLFLPETRGKSLPVTIEDVEDKTTSK